LGLARCTSQSLLGDIGRAGETRLSRLAAVAKLVDAPDLESGGARREKHPVSVRSRPAARIPSLLHCDSAVKS
jgi:hypothetical protein